VVLEYKDNSFDQSDSKKINKNNKFIKDQNFSTSHTVKDGESLSEIINKFYGNTGLNMRIIQLSLTEINKHAFVRNNPNYLFAGKKLKIPSINEIMNLVKNKPNQRKTSSNRGNNHIYFYGN
jgi:LysM repeat protein